MVYLQRCLNVTWLVPRETAAVSAQLLCTPYNDAPVYIRRVHVRLAVTCHLHLWQNDRDLYIRRVQVRLAVTCHLHFWQNDLDLLRATAVTRGVERIPK